MDIMELLNQPAPTMSKQLRRRQSVGDLGMLTGDPVLGQLGQNLGESAGSEAWRDTQTEMNRRNVLSRALEEEAERKFRGQEAATQREWMGQQNAMNRGLERAIAELRASNTGGLTYKDVMRYRKDLGRDLVGARMPEIEKSMSQVESVLSKYPEGTDLPGIGMGALSPGADARELRSTHAAIRNIILAARSGAAVTEPEAERLEQELLGKGVFNIATDADFRRGWNFLKERIAAQKKGILDSYDPEIVELFEGDDSTGEVESEDPFAGMSDAELRAIADGKP